MIPIDYLTQKKNPLDSRGYCVNSKISFELDYDFKPTLPSKYYPSAAPYASLTEYLRELIQDKILTRFIVKALLYPEFLRDIDTTEVKLRKRHKTFVRMYRRGSSTTSSGESETSSERLERQNAIEYNTSEGGSRVYSNVRYRTDKTDSWEGTVYESFIDHGEDAGEVCYQRLHDSVSSFCFVTECDSPTRESFMIGSTPVRYVDNRRQNSNDNMLHLTTAKITLLDIKQKSEQSQTSSFDHKLAGGGGWKNMACEDLLNIDDSMNFRNAGKEKPLQEKHHSMPVQFVGNRFNVSSMTEIYIPSCKSQNDATKNVLGTPCNSFEEEEQAHSSSVQMRNRAGEDTIDAPDQLTAEILYNLERFEQSSTREPTPSDERMSIDKGNPFNQPHPEPEPPFANKRIDSKFMPPATIYSSDSDSGMAGSYTLSPSDQFGCHRSFISHKFNPHVTPSSIDFYPPPTANEDFSERRPSLRHQSSSLEGENRSKVVINFESGVKSLSTGDNVFISGMYAHWWKKEKLPLAMIESLAQLCGDDSDSQARGSGKKPLKNHFNDVALSCFMQNSIIIRSCGYVRGWNAAKIVKSGF